KEAKGDHDGAIADYNRAIELNPKYAGAYNNRGLAKQARGLSSCLAREAKGDLDGAIADYDRAIELDPKLAISYHNRVLAQKAKGDLDAGIVRGFSPNQAGYYVNRGIT